MLNFITQNTNLVGLITVSLTGGFVFIKWLDARKRELKERRYTTYMALVSIISGKRADSSTANMTEQIAATWFLLEYKEYYDITKKIFLNNDFENMADPLWVTHVLPHIKMLLKEIS